MELILIKDVPNLGSLGDTVQVKSGYGRNYLVPKGMALLSKGKESKELRHRLDYLKKLRQDKIDLAKDQASKLEALDLEVSRKAGPEGKLFGSVNNRDIEKLLRENKFDFGRRAIIINTPIRKVGTHEFTVRIHSEVSQSMKIKVIGDTQNTDLSEKSNNEIESSDSKDNSNFERKINDIDIKKSTEDKIIEEKIEVKENESPKETKKPKEKLKNFQEVEDLGLKTATKENKDLKKNNKDNENQKNKEN